MKVSTSLNVFYTHYPVEQAIARGSRAGFEALDLNYWDYQPAIQRMSWTEEEAWARNIAEVAHAHNIRFTQMHGPVLGSSFEKPAEGLDEDSFIELAGRSLRTAAILGIPWVVFHPQNLTQLGNEPIRETREFNRKYYERLLPVMEETGVGIALENIFDMGRQTAYRRRSFGATPEELIDLIDSFGHPLFGACWDTGHAHVQGLNQGASIRMLSDRLITLHIQDNNSLADQHLLPFHGTIAWREVMEALCEISYKGDLTYEAHMSVRVLPDELKDAALSYAVQVGKFLRDMTVQGNREA